MKFGVMFVNTGPCVEGEAAVRLAQAAEDAGFDSLWAVEHVVVPKGYESPYPYHASGKMPGGQEDFDLPDPLIWLSYVAAVTRTIRLATGILILPQRNPVITAKAVASLDRLSGGRMILGIGTGWLREEFTALGIPFERRGARADDYLRAMRALWTEECPTYEGEFVSFRNAYCRPQPAQGRVPIVIGGDTKRAARRAGEFGDGYFPGSRDVGRLANLFDVVRESARASGRDPETIELTVMGGSTDYHQHMADLGVSRIVVPPMRPDAMARFGDEVIGRFS